MSVWVLLSTNGWDSDLNFIYLCTGLSMSKYIEDSLSEICAVQMPIISWDQVSSWKTGIVRHHFFPTNFYFMQNYILLGSSFCIWILPYWIPILHLKADSQKLTIFLWVITSDHSMNIKIICFLCHLATISDFLHIVHEQYRRNT